MSLKSMKSIVDVVNKLGKDAGFTSSVVITSAAASLAAYKQSSPVSGLPTASRLGTTQ